MHRNHQCPTRATSAASPANELKPTDRLLDRGRACSRNRDDCSRYETVTGALTAVTEEPVPSARSIVRRTTTRYRPGASGDGSSVGPLRVAWASSNHASIVHMRPGSSTGFHVLPSARSSDLEHGLNV